MFREVQLFIRKNDWLVILVSMFVSFTGMNIIELLYPIPDIFTGSLSINLGDGAYEFNTRMEIIVIAFLSLLFGIIIFYWIRYPKRFHRYLHRNIKRSMRNALLEVTDRNFEINRSRFTPEKIFMEKVEDDLEKEGDEKKDLSIYALCGHKPWGKKHTKCYFGYMYKLAKKKVEYRRKKIEREEPHNPAEEAHKPPIVTRIFLEPIEGFSKDNDDDMDTWNHMCNHKWREKEGVKVKIIKKDIQKSRHKLGRIGKDLLAGLGFVIIQPPIIIDREGRPTITRYAYLHYGKGDRFKYVKCTDANLVEEVWNMYRDISSNSVEFDETDAYYGEITKVDVKGTNRIDNCSNVKSSTKCSKTKSSTKCSKTESSTKCSKTESSNKCSKTESSNKYSKV